MALLNPSGKFCPMGGDFDIFGDNVLYQSSTGIGEEGVLPQSLAGDGVICSESKGGLSIGDFVKERGRPPISLIVRDDIKTGMEQALTVIIKWKNGGNGLRPGMVDFLKCYCDSFSSGKLWQEAKDLLGLDHASSNPKKESRTRIPSLSSPATNLLLWAATGNRNLVNWYTFIWYSWDELPIINDLYGGGFLKWRLGNNLIILTASNDGSLYGQKLTGYQTTFENGIPIEKKTEEEYRLYEFWNGARSLLQCFFMVFPEIDRVDTEKISGLGFKNPFLFLHEPEENPSSNIGNIKRGTFFQQAIACHGSSEFTTEWERLKAARIDNLPNRIDQLWNELSTVDLVGSHNETHGYLVDAKAKVDTFVELVLAVRNLQKSKIDVQNNNLKEVKVTSENVLNWIVWHVEDDWELKKLLDDFIQEYKRPPRAEFTLAGAIEAFLNRPRNGKGFTGNEPSIETLPELYQYLYLTFKGLYESGTSKNRFLEFATERMRGKTQMKAERENSTGEHSKDAGLPSAPKKKNMGLPGIDEINAVQGKGKPKPKKKIKFSDDTHTPPISAAELASKLCVLPSLISNQQRPLGKLFNKCREDQGVNNPRLEYDALWTVARESVRRSHQPGAEDLVLNDRDDLVRLFM